MERVLSIAWSESDRLSAAAEAVKKLLEECVRDLVSQGKLIGRILKSG
ncbi:hypothetical protein [Aliiruegeria lutimaris]|nr:hypothetical protein [Aliiruegeria lutimaris]